MPEFVRQNIAGNYFAGRDQANAEHQQKRMNALADRRMQMEDRQIQQQDMMLDQEQQKQLATIMLQAAQYGLQSPNPKAFIEQNYPQLAQLAGDQWATLDDNGVKMKLQEAVGVWGPKAGVGPAQPKAQEGFTLSEGQTRYGPDGRPIASAAPKREKPLPAFRPMSPDEVKAAGLPAGTAAQVNTGTGQINVISRRDATANLSQKDAATAKQKLITLNLARQQLQNIRQRFNEIKGSLVAGGGGQGRLPTPKGQAFDRAVDQMRSTLTALTKVPGIGAMSDYETRLDQAKFPSRTDYENVTEQQIDSIARMLETIETGYKGLLGEQPQEQEQQDFSQLSDEDLLRALGG